MKKTINLLQKIVFVTIAIGGLAACTPEVGSPEWCEKMEKKDKGEWTVNEGKDFLKHCLIKKDKK